MDDQYDDFEDLESFRGESSLNGYPVLIQLTYLKSEVWTYAKEIPVSKLLVDLEIELCIPDLFECKATCISAEGTITSQATAELELMFSSDTNFEYEYLTDHDGAWELKEALGFMPRFYWEDQLAEFILFKGFLTDTVRRHRRAYTKHEIISWQACQASAEDFFEVLESLNFDVPYNVHDTQVILKANGIKEFPSDGPTSAAFLFQARDGQHKLYLEDASGICLRYANCWILPDQIDRVYRHMNTIVTTGMINGILGKGGHLYLDLYNELLEFFIGYHGGDFSTLDNVNFNQQTPLAKRLESFEINFGSDDVEEAEEDTSDRFDPEKIFAPLHKFKKPNSTISFFNTQTGEQIVVAGQIIGCVTESPFKRRSDYSGHSGRYTAFYILKTESGRFATIKLVESLSSNNASGHELADLRISRNLVEAINAFPMASWMKESLLSHSDAPTTFF